MPSLNEFRSRTAASAVRIGLAALAAAATLAACASNSGGIETYSTNDDEPITRKDFVATVDCAALPEGVSCDCVIDEALALVPFISGYQPLTARGEYTSWARTAPGAQRDSRLHIAAHRAEQVCAAKTEASDAES